MAHNNPSYKSVMAAVQTQIPANAKPVDSLKTATVTPAQADVIAANTDEATAALLHLTPAQQQTLQDLQAVAHMKDTAQCVITASPTIDKTFYYLISEPNSIDAKHDRQRRVHASQDSRYRTPYVLEVWNR